MEVTQFSRLRSTLKFEPNRASLVGLILTDSVIIGGIVTLILWGENWALLTAAPLIAVVCFRAFSAMHEATHGALDKNRRLNDVLGVLWGAICFLPYAQWRTGHLEHHLWAGNIERDPVMKLCIYVRRGGKLPVIVEWAWKVWVPVLSILQQSVFWYNCALLVRKSPTVLNVASVLAPLFLWTGAMIGFGLNATLLALLPGIVGYLVLIEIVNFPHHLELPQKEGKTRLAPMHQFEIARSCSYPRWFERWVLLNFNYHVEHHLFPTLPWGELRATHLILKAELGSKYNFEPGFTWIIRNRHRKLADVLYSPNQIETPAEPVQAHAA